jgi:hypothetical protein
MADFDNSLASWRDVYGAVEQSAKHESGGIEESDYLRRKQAKLASLCLTSVQVHEQFITQLKELVTTGSDTRDQELQQLVEDYAASALHKYTHHSLLALWGAIQRVIDEPPPVIVRHVTKPLPPRPKSLTDRFLGR